MKNNHEHLQSKVEKKQAAKEKRKRKKMKVSGKSVIGLKQIIEKKTK